MPLDPSQFLNMSVEGSNETSFVPVPAGEYLMQIDPENGIDIRTFVNKNGENGAIMNVRWNIVDEKKLPKVQELTGMKQPSARQSVFLDAIFKDGQDGRPEVIGIQNGPGKNINLGRLRETLGQNDPNKKWNPRMLLGKTAKCKVEHKPDTRPGHEKDVFAEVTEITK